MMLPPQLHKILAVAFFLLPFCAPAKLGGFFPFFGGRSDDQQIPGTPNYLYVYLLCSVLCKLCAIYHNLTCDLLEVK